MFCRQTDACVSARMTTYDDDDKVKPAPGVGEVLLEAVRAHLDHHLADEDHREHFVHVLQYHPQHFPLRQVDVFNCLVISKN